MSSLPPVSSSSTSPAKPSTQPSVNNWSLEVRHESVRRLKHTNPVFVEQLFNNCEKTEKESGLIKELRPERYKKNEVIESSKGTTSIADKVVDFCSGFSRRLSSLATVMGRGETRESEETVLSRKVASNLEEIEVSEVEAFEATYKYLINIEDKQRLFSWLEKLPKKDRIENLIKIATYANNLMHYSIAAEIFISIYKESPTEFKNLANGWIRKNGNFPEGIWQLFDHLENWDSQAADLFSESFFSEVLTSDEKAKLWKTLFNNDLLACSFLKRLEDNKNEREIEVRTREVLKHIQQHKNILAESLIEQFLPTRQLVVRDREIIGYQPLRVMSKFLSNLQSTTSLFDETKSKLSIMQEKIRDAQIRDNKHQVLKSNFFKDKENYKVYLENMAREFSGEVAELKDGEFLILPINCWNAHEGHAIQLVIQRKNDNISLMVYNSGLGVSKWHPQQPNTTRHQSFFELDEIPIDAFRGIKGEKNLAEILSSSLGDSPKLGPVVDQFYETLIRIAGKPPDYRPPPSTNPFHYKLEQATGNCMTQCLFRLLNGMLIPQTKDSSSTLKEQHQYKLVVAILKQQAFRFISLASKFSTKNTKELELTAQFTAEKSQTALDLSELALKEGNYSKLYTLLSTFPAKGTVEGEIEVPATAEERFLKLKELSSVSVEKYLNKKPEKHSKLLDDIEEIAKKESDPEKKLMLKVIQKKLQYALALPIRIENSAIRTGNAHPLYVLEQLVKEIKIHDISPSVIRQTVSRLLSLRDDLKDSFPKSAAEILKELCKDSRNIPHVFEIIRAINHPIKHPEVSEIILEHLFKAESKENLKAEWKKNPLIVDLFSFFEKETVGSTIQYLIIPFLKIIPPQDRPELENKFPILTLIKPFLGSSPSIAEGVKLVFNTIEQSRENSRNVIGLYKYLQEYQPTLFKDLITAIGKHPNWTTINKRILLKTPYSWSLPLEAFPDCPMAISKRVTGYLQDRRQEGDPKLSEGASAWQTTQFFAESLKDMDLSSSSIEESTKQSIHKLSEKMAKCSELSAKLFMIEESTKIPLIESDRAIQIKKISQELEKEVRDLKTGDFLIIPVESHNHSTRLVITKQEDGKFKLDLYNAGAGLHKWHPYYIENGEERFQTFFELKDILQENLSKDNFTKLISSFFSSSIHIAYKILVKDFAKRPMPDFTKSPHAPLKEPPPNPLDFKLPQDANNCTSQCMQRLLHGMIMHPTTITTLTPEERTTLTPEERYHQYKLVVSQLKKEISEGVHADNKEGEGNEIALSQAKRAAQKSGVNPLLSDLAKDKATFEIAYANLQDLANKLNLPIERIEDPNYFDNKGSRFLALKKVNKSIADELLTRNISPEKFKEFIGQFLELSTWNPFFDALEQRYANSFEALPSLEKNVKKRYSDNEKTTLLQKLDNKLWRVHFSNELIDMIGNGKISKAELIELMNKNEKDNIYIVLPYIFLNKDNAEITEGLAKKIAGFCQNLQALPVFYQLAELLFSAAKEDPEETKALSAVFRKETFGTEERADHVLKLFYKLADKEISESTFTSIFGELKMDSQEKLFDFKKNRKALETLKKWLTDPKDRERFYNLYRVLPGTVQIEFENELVKDADKESLFAELVQSPIGVKICLTLCSDNDDLLKYFEKPILENLKKWLTDPKERERFYNLYCTLPGTVQSNFASELVKDADIHDIASLFADLLQSDLGMKICLTLCFINRDLFKNFEKPVVANLFKGSKNEILQQVAKIISEGSAYEIYSLMKFLKPHSSPFDLIFKELEKLPNWDALSENFKIFSSVSEDFKRRPKPVYDPIAD